MLRIDDPRLLAAKELEARVRRLGLLVEDERWQDATVALLMVREYTAHLETMVYRAQLDEEGHDAS